MSPPVLLVILNAATPESLQEGLRIGVGLRAADHALEIWCESAPKDLEGEAETYLDALAEEGVFLAASDPAALKTHLSAASAIIRIAPTPRVGQPEVLLIDDEYLANIDPATLLCALREAGQVIRT